MCKDFILLFEFYKVGSDTGIGNSLSTKQRNNMEWTPKHLVMHLIACRLSYHASSMHGIVLSVKMIMTFRVFFWACRFWHRIDSKESCTPSNCLWIVIFHILCEQTWHILTSDNNFWGWMIPAKGIPCIFIAALPVNAKTEFIIIHVVQHQIACRLSYYASYMHGNGISRILRTTLGGIWYC
jgi:hypothetical protein